MSKIICEVCGTRYPDTAEQCPICGYVKDAAENESEQEVQEEVLEIPERPKVPGGRFSKKNVRKRLKTQEAYAVAEERSRAEAKEEEEEEEEYESEEETEEEYEEESAGKGGTVLNVLLVLVIIALLAVSALIFVKYFMPGFLDKEPEVAPTEAYVEQTEAPTEITEEQTEAPTEAPTVPCQQLVLDVTDVTLKEAGAMYLLNIQILPEDTTDQIVYISSNEEVATVNEEGRITAVAEGSVVITVVCGEQQLECNVVCNFSAEEATEAPTEAPAEEGETKTVTSNYVNIRSGAGTGHEKVGEYKKGDVVTIYEEKTVGGRPWGRTDKGWICTEYVK